jgi:RimJ/RimL family protein N-acetyltransferase
VPSFPDLSEPLTDGAVSLRLAAERDIPEVLIAYQDDRTLHLRLGIERPPSGADLGQRSEGAERDRAAGERIGFTVLEPDSDVCRGQVYTSSVNWHHRRAELGMWLAPQIRGRGLAPRALALASRWLLERAGLERVQVLTEPENEPMLRTAAAAGYQREGTLRAYTLERGTRVDCVMLSLLASDRPA